MASCRKLARNYEHLAETIIGLHMIAFSDFILKRFSILFEILWQLPAANENQACLEKLPHTGLCVCLPDGNSNGCCCDVFNLEFEMRQTKRRFSEFPSEPGCNQEY